MPLFSFDCSEHGLFRKVVVASTKKAMCPKCNRWVSSQMSSPISRVRVSTERGERAETMREEELEVRMAAAVDEAHQVSRDRRERRLEAKELLSETELDRQAQEVEYRKKVESVMKSEPEENLEAVGLKIWRREEEHADRMKKKKSTDR